MKKVYYCLFVLLLVTFGVLIARRSSAQTSPQTRIYISWFSGDDAGYASLLQVHNTTMDPYGSTAANGTCAVDAYFNGTHYGPGTTPLTVNAGQVAVFTLAQVQAATTGLALANSGQRAYLFLTCNFPLAHAQTLVVNPGGVPTVFPGFIIPPNRTFATGPEQLLQ